MKPTRDEIQDALKNIIKSIAKLFDDDLYVVTGEYHGGGAMKPTRNEIEKAAKIGIARGTCTIGGDLIEIHVADEIMKLFDDEPEVVTVDDAIDWEVSLGIQPSSPEFWVTFFKRFKGRRIG